MLYDRLMRPPGLDPSATALVCGELRLSRADLDRAATALAGQLAGRGVVPETPLALIMPNSPEQVVAILAAIRLEARLVLLDPALKPTELEAYCRRASVRLALVCSGNASVPDDVGSAPVVRLSPINALLDAGARPEPALPDAGGSDRTSFVFLSSGSTGMPKLVLRFPESLLHGSALYRHTWPCGPEDRTAAILPLFHGWGLRHLLWTTLLGGAPLHLLPPAPRLLATAVARERITVLSTTPFVLRLLVETDFRPVPDFGSLWLVVSSGSPLSPALAGRFREKFGLGPAQVYGTAEGGSIMYAEFSDCLDGEWLWRTVADVAVTIRDSDGRDVPDGSIGTLAARSPGRASGYLGEPEATASTFASDWVLTGDLAARNADGRFRLMGRSRPMLNVAGEKASPAEIEACLRQHPAVTEAKVLGIKTPDGADRIKAIVATSEEVGAQDLRDFCAARLAAFKVPRAIEFAAAAAAGPLSKPRLQDRSGGDPQARCPNGSDRTKS